MGLANRRALALAHISAATPDPYGGVIDRCPASGRPLGIVRDAAMQLVTAVVPEPPVAERRAAMEAAFAHLLSRVRGPPAVILNAPASLAAWQWPDQPASRSTQPRTPRARRRSPCHRQPPLPPASHAHLQGVTTAADLGRFPFADIEAPWRDLRQLYLPAAAAGALPLRLAPFVPLGSAPRLARLLAEQVSLHRSGRRCGQAMHAPGSGARAAPGRLLTPPRAALPCPAPPPPQGWSLHPSRRLLLGQVKEFADGSLGSRTALMHAPYADDPANSCGTRTVELAPLAAALAAAHAAGGPGC